MPFIEQEKGILSDRGLHIFTALSGEEALTIHRTEKVDLIVTRLDMTGMCGDTLCSLIRSDDSLKRVSLLLICENRQSDLERCMRCGANTYITRPVDPAAFIEKVGSLVEVPKRSGIRVLVKVSVKGNVKNQSFFCTSVNISTSGILLEMDRIISRGDVVTCSFFIPGSDSIAVDCGIVRAVTVAPGLFHYGARFLNLRPEHESAIKAFIRKRTA